jgi:hypothetical protein
MMKTEDIKSRDDFVQFLIALSKDCEQNSDKWENKTLTTFISAMSAWSEDMDGYYKNMGLLDQMHLDDANWRVFADILAAARIYE